VTSTSAPASTDRGGVAARAAVPPWAWLDPDEVAARLDVDPAQGLTEAEVARRQAEHGPNRLAEPARRPEWKKFLDQFRSGIVAILAAAAVVAGAVGDVKDTVVIAIVLLINAVLGYVQEAKAETAMVALERMLVATVRVRRAGGLAEVPIDDLVPGDIVLLEPGDRVPADGRLLVAAGLSIDESAFTGESVPVDKSTAAIDATAVIDAGAGATVDADADVDADDRTTPGLGPDVGPDLGPGLGSDLGSGVDLPIGDRVNQAFLNTTVARGRAELVVTETGMQTEMGRVAELLAAADPGPTPLERQLDGLSARLAVIAVGAVALVFVLQLVQGVGFTDAMLGAVALAVAAIPEGLPAVVTVTLAVGVSQMATRHAIVKRLHSVETLGSTTVICSDKTGTLTLNQMTASQLVVGDVEVDIAGTGYGTEGGLAVGGRAVTDLDDRPDLVAALEVGALCNDAVVRDGSLVGDPTEGALVVAAAKAGIDVAATRTERPRIGEVPFDSAARYMATFHADGDDVVCCAKGAPDRLLARCARVADGRGGRRPVDEGIVDEQIAHNDRLASSGLRVLAVASRRYPRGEVEVGSGGVVVDPERYVDGLVLGGLVGIVDPPREEAREAIAVAHRAGIDVKMITGDHATTAGSIAAALGIDGEVVSGDELEAMDDDELARRIDSIGVCARVSPEHKVRVVRALKANGHVAAMTGDGVNDAAALRTADIGVAMGITGTEVTKEAADMVLVDDNFATIVGAVERGRTIYANIVKFVRFQLSTNLGAITTILGASLLALPVPFSAIQVLWVNLIADGPPAISLGVDPPDGREMRHAPRAADASILTGRRVGRLLWFAAIMATGTLGLLAWSRDRWDEPVALSMTFTVFVLFQMFNVFNARTEGESVFSRQMFANRKMLLAVAAVVVLQVLAVQWGPLQRLFGTASVTWSQVGLCFVVASTILWLEELRKVGARLLARRRVPPVAGPVIAAGHLGADPAAERSAR
jgi:Ca2+-transporting ATPase